MLNTEARPGTTPLELAQFARAASSLQHHFFSQAIIAILERN